MSTDTLITIAVSVCTALFSAGSVYAAIKHTLKQTLTQLEELKKDQLKQDADLKALALQVNTLSTKVEGFKPERIEEYNKVVLQAMETSVKSFSESIMLAFQSTSSNVHQDVRELRGHYTQILEKITFVQGRIEGGPWTPKKDN